MGIADEIKKRQAEWAREDDIATSSKGYYCRKLENNLFRRMKQKTREDFENADGSELYGKIHALHSSSALACNFFDYWRRAKDTAPLAGALGVDKVHGVSFERKFPTGLRGKSPNLDVVLTVSSQTILAIESKFTEPFSGSKNKKCLKDGYFSGGKKRWSQLGLSGCQKLAEDLRREHGYKHLDAAQLLKHMLGLATQMKTNREVFYQEWNLLYLWFDPGEPEAEAECHKEEIKQFIGEVSHDGEKVGGGGAIRAMTYQELFDKLSQRLNASHKKYKEYLAQRYFSED